MIPLDIDCLLESVNIKQLISSNKLDNRIFDFELQGRSIIWNVRLFFCPKFPFTLPSAELLNDEFIGKIPHVNANRLLCIEEGDSILIDYHSPAEVIKSFLIQTIKTLDRSSLKVFKDELYDEIEGFLYGARTVNSFYRASDKVEMLYLRLAKTDRLFKSHITHPVAISKNISDIPISFSNTETLSKFQIVNILHVPLDIPVVPLLNTIANSDFIVEMKKQISDENKKIISDLLKYKIKEKRQYYILLSMPRTNGERTELLFSFKVKTGSLHPMLTDNIDWNIEPFLLNRHNKEYLLERGGAVLSINSKTVSIVGCGSVGGEIAMLIAKSGVGKLKLIDADQFKSDNIYRHYLGGRYLNFATSPKNGKMQTYSKVAALKREIETNIPHITVEAFKNLLSEKNINNILKTSDITIIAIGDPSISLLLNKFLKKNGYNNVIFCWNEPDGYGGHSISLNLEKVCLECVFFPENLNTSNIGFIEFGQPITKNLTGCAGVFTPFSNLDSTKTATLAAQQAVSFLTSGLIEEKAISWKGVDKGTLRTTERFRRIQLMDEISLQKNKNCRCCRSGY